MESRPKARIHGIVVEELDHGLVVYDSARNQAHSLDGDAARIWRLADGTRTVGEIAAAAGLSCGVIEGTVDRLQAQNLLLEDPALSRRKLLKRTAMIGAGALAAAPLIETVVIPTAAAHASVPNIPNHPPGGPPLVLEQPAVVHTPGHRPGHPPGHPPGKKKKKKRKHIKHRRRHHKPPGFTGARDRKYRLGL